MIRHACWDGALAVGLFERQALKPTASQNQQLNRVSCPLCLCAAVTPPGFKTVNGSTVPCESGAYREGWLPPELASSCTSCGSGIFADKTDRVMQYDLVTMAPSYLPVTTSSGDCCKSVTAVGDRGKEGAGLVVRSSNPSWAQHQPVCQISSCMSKV